jgi:hypothetical protein
VAISILGPVSNGLEQPSSDLLETVLRVADVPEGGQFFGLGPEDHCPCGSQQEARDCHRASDHSWIALRPPALLKDDRTGYANPGCYAHRSNDCSDDLTLEHYLTEDLLEAISADKKVVMLEGAAWLDNDAKQKTIGMNSLASRMLCGRHNRALSPLDTMATQFFHYFRGDQLDVMRFQGNYFQRDFTLISGPYLELWLLKVLWGAIEAGAMEVEGSRAYRFRLGVSTQQLAEILWRGAEWPPHWGMYVLHNQNWDHPVKQNSVQLRPASMGSEILGGFIQIAGFEFLISFELPPVSRIYRPGGLTFQRNGFPRRCWKMFAFAWPEIGHPVINVVSAVPPDVDFTAPPNPYAASLANQILAGSLKVTSGAQPDAGTGGPSQPA